MEAFGNAKTLRNDNSSRFGKYQVVQFDYGGAPLGAIIQTYLLEKPRVVYQQEGERNFHIFYNLCAGASGSMRQELGLQDAKAYKYINTTVQVKGMDDDADFGEVDSAMDTLIGNDNKMHLYKIVAGVLHLGNVTFKQPGGGDKSDAIGHELAARVLDVDVGRLNKALTHRTIKTRGESVVSPLKPDECQKTRDALAKALYARGFKQLVALLNESLKTNDRVELTLGLLDVFGFEIFKRNSFEQLLINYCNEKLQQIFVKLTLESEQKEYAAEGLKWVDIPYFNNAIVCELIDSKGKPQPGIIAYCDEEAIMPQATDKSLLSKLNTNLGKHPHFVDLTKDAKGGDKTEFLVKHYAGDVTYSTEGFVEKNMDTLYRDLIELIGSSKSKMMADLFPEAKEAHDGKKPITAGSQFRTDMQALMDTLLLCDPHYVRTIKPNDNKQSGVFEASRVAHQVRYLGLLENVRVRRAGFAYRHVYNQFVHRYKMVSPAVWLKFPPSGDVKKDARAILESMAISGEGESFAMGKTKIFIRRPESLFALEEMRERKMHDVCAMIQGAWRLFKARKHFLELREKSMGIFQGKKRRRGSWVLFFQGDYIFAKDSLELQQLFTNPKIGGNDRKIIFADRCEVLGKKNKMEMRYLIFTEKSVYTADLKWKTARRVDLHSIQKWSLSTFADGFVVLKCPPDMKGKPQEDIVFNSVRKAEIVTVLSENQKLPLEFSDTISFMWKKSSLFSAKIVEGTLTFIEREVSGNNFTELVPEKDDLGKITVNVSPQMGSKAALQLSSKGPDRAIATLAGKAAAGFIDNKKPVKTPRGVASPTDFSSSGGGGGGGGASGGAMAPLSDTGGLKKAKCLYEYKGSNAKDLQLKEGQVVFVIKQHDDGWWDGQVDGKRGLFPASYVELM
jgi:myosin-1